MTSATGTDFFDSVHTPEYSRNPYPYFATVREYSALRSPSGIWLIGRYSDVAAGMRDSRLSCDLATLDSGTAYFRARGIDDRFPLPLNALDPPDHPRIRSAVAREFLPQAVNAMQPAINEAVRTVLDGLTRRTSGIIDLVAEFAYPVPISIIGGLFGIPEPDWPLLERWSRAFGAVSDPDALLDDEARRAGAEATREAGEYFGRLVLRRRRRPGPDVLSRWLGLLRDERAMTLPELLVNGVFLLIVGHHNTVSLLANGMLALLANPDRLAALRANPDLFDTAVDELLRYDSPVQTATRVTIEDYRLPDVVIPANSQVMLLVGSANRDPDVFPRPDELRLDRRSSGRHVGFGRGAHACVGALLARIEARSALRGLLHRFPVIEQAGEPRRRVPCFSLRGVESLPVRLG